MILYQCSPLPVRRLQPTESYNPLLFSSFSSKGATTPLALALAKILVRRCQPTEGYNLLFLPGTTFHKFLDQIHEHQSIFKNTISFSPIKTESNRNFSNNCTQNIVTITTQQILNLEHCSNKQKQLEHNSRDVRYFNNQKPACIRFCVWTNLHIRCFYSQNQRVYAPLIH